MSGSLKNKLSRYETALPPGTWEDISNELDKEFVPSDSVLASKIEYTSMHPPHAAWAEIESFLDNERNPAKQSMVIPLFYKRIAIAVMLSAAVSVSVMYLFTARQIQNEPEVAIREKNNPDIKTDVSRMLHVPSPATEIATEPLTAHTGIIQSGPRLYAPQASTISYEEPETSREINEAYFAKMQTVNAEQPVIVPALPIRDAGGNIIMDIKLISKPNDPYITVTGPNGSQTKISNKFINCLGYLNGDISSDDTNNDGIIWKDRFQSWRDKLLSEDNFIPAANNFFDIFEMKDMIQE